MKGRVTGSSTTTAPSGSSGAGASGGSSSASAGCHSNIIRIIKSVSFKINFIYYMAYQIVKSLMLINGIWHTMSESDYFCIPEIFQSNV